MKYLLVTMKVNVIIACGGNGTRTGLPFNKILADLNGKPVIYQTVTKFSYINEVTRIIIPASIEDTDLIKDALGTLDMFDMIVFCPNGDTRTKSIQSALTCIESDADIISIHDGARPFVTNDCIINSFETAKKCGSGISAYGAVDTIAFINEHNQICNIPDRNTIFNIQTPQSFIASKIISAYSIISDSDSFSDDSSVYTKYIGQPTVSKGDISNKKITFATDLQSFKGCFAGTGYDTHALVADRDLILGGIKIPYHLGLLGHSDADVLTHAIMDALFSCCSERDIGVHFPDNDPAFKGIDSTILLSKCLEIITRKGFSINNISCVIMCEKPKLAKLIPDIITNLTSIMSIPYDALMISATTTEGLGFIGRGEGIAVSCNCICCKIKENI